MGVIYDTHSILDNPVLYSNQVIILIFFHETFSLHSIDISQINLQHFMNSFFTTLRYVFLLFKETLSSLFYFKIKIKTKKKIKCQPRSFIIWFPLTHPNFHLFTFNMCPQVWCFHCFSNTLCSFLNPESITLAFVISHHDFFLDHFNIHVTYLYTMTFNLTSLTSLKINTIKSFSCSKVFTIFS